MPCTSAMVRRCWGKGKSFVSFHTSFRCLCVLLWSGSLWSMPGGVHLAMVDVDMEEEVATTETEVDMEDGEYHVCTCMYIM